ncbi:hypothetical protein AVEN_75224-1 [Araneus ventricosus]|uniref:Integrase zinc-binding domain-containing protein n=1 Tax=Araneus ventricosus TaxID=182803 RepID=A0A4Y2P823_ARAVE|nr:hypothetical protein AVEN_75224-1 [Araneus ventricosus]
MDTLDRTLRSLETENIECKSSPIREELKYCNEHYEKTHYRNSEGRYVQNGLAKDERSNLPMASKLLLENFYMDDCLSDAPDIKQFMALKKELGELLLRGGMTLHKWCSSAGPQALHNIRQKFWGLNERNLCRKIVHSCVACFKAIPEISSQKMGDLPEDRVNHNFVFNSVGMDFAGSFYTKTKLRKRDPPTKIYVCNTLDEIHSS